MEELKVGKIASEIFWPLKTPNYLHVLTNFWPVKVHVKSLGWKNTYPQVWRNVQIKKLGSILILLTKSVLDMDMKLISCSPESDNEFRFLNLWFFFTNLYDLLLICTWSLSFSKPALFQTWKKKVWLQISMSTWECKNQAQIDKGYVSLVCLRRRQSL